MELCACTSSEQASMDRIKSARQTLIRFIVDGRMPFPKVTEVTGVFRKRTLAEEKADGQVANFEGLSREFFRRSGSRILRVRVAKKADTVGFFGAGGFKCRWARARLFSV